MSKTSKRGLTLIEMLISLSLMAIMAVILANAMDFGRQAWVRSNKIAPLETHALARHDLRKWLEHYDPKHPFTVAENSFSFKHWPKERPHPRAVEYTVTLSRTRDGAVDSLILTIASKAEHGQIAFTQTRELAADLQNLTFQYYGQKDRASPAKWHKDWPEELGHPDLVRIEADRRSGVPWPPLIVRVGIFTKLSVVDVREPRPKD